MRTYNELNMKAETATGTLKVSVNRCKDGTYLVNTDFYDRDGFYIAYKSSERIAANVDELINDTRLVRY